MLTNLLKDLGEIGVAIGGDGDMKVVSVFSVLLARWHEKNAIFHRGFIYIYIYTHTHLTEQRFENVGME
jgi:hypothetical protein